MSDDLLNWWSHTTEQSVKLVLEYMPMKPRAVIGSSLSVRVWSELEDTVEKKASEDTAINEHEWKRMKKEDGLSHPVCFIKDEKHPTYSLCEIDVHDIKMVQRLLWWLQRTHPRAIQLLNVDKLSAGDLRQVLDVLFSDEPVVPEGVPLYTNLLEFSINSKEIYECSNILQALGKCSLLRKLDLSKCQSLGCLEGLEKFTHLEELDLSYSSLDDLSGLQNCEALKILRLNECKNLNNIDALNAVVTLTELDLSESSVEDLTPLSQCMHMTILNLSGCTSVESVAALSGMTDLTEVRLDETLVADLSPLANCVSIKKLHVKHCQEVHSVAPLSGMLNLQYLDFVDTGVEDLAPLSNCEQLHTLLLRGCGSMENLEALRNMTALQCLDLESTSVENIAPIANCKQLQYLSLVDCDNVQSVAPLAGMTMLRSLDLKYTSVEDITPLANCTELTDLQVTGTYIDDFSPLQGLIDRGQLNVDVLYGKYTN